MVGRVYHGVASSDSSLDRSFRKLSRVAALGWYHARHGAYERARSRLFSAEERHLIAATAVRQLGYLARCQYALRTRVGDSKPWPMERMLPMFASWLDTSPVW